MRSQSSFAFLEAQSKKRRTRNERFLAAMELIVPFARMEAVIEPFYPKGERGRPPIGLSRMLRINPHVADVSVTAVIRFGLA